jgi:hypothetical protein
MSRVQRWPTFVPYSLQYNWTVAGGVRNILTIYNVSKLDKGKHISCRATDDNGLPDIPFLLKINDDHQGIPVIEIALIVALSTNLLQKMFTTLN